MTKFRILSLDGGGVRGVIPARILQHIEETTGKPISSLFDLIVGTSTGGLIALGLVVGTGLNHPVYRAKDIVDVYMQYAHLIFEKSLLQTIMTGGGLWAAKYNPEGYYKILHSLFGNTFLHQAITPVLIPTYSLIKGEPNIFSSSCRNSPEKPPVFLGKVTNSEGMAVGGMIRQMPVKIVYLMSDIAASTSAAPTYFPPKIFTDNLNNNYMEIDGGIFANNPEELAITEAMTLNPDLRREDIEIVSIGTGTPKIALPAKELINSGMFGWVAKANILDVMMNASSEWDSDEASMTCPNNTRLQITLSTELDSMDNSSDENMKALMKATEDYIATNKETIDKVIANLINPA